MILHSKVCFLFQKLKKEKEKKLQKLQVKILKKNTMREQETQWMIEREKESVGGSEKKYERSQ